MELFMERDLEQYVERVRFTKPDRNKEVVIDTKLPINFKTTKMTRVEYMKSIDAYEPREMPVVCLKWIKDNVGITFTTFNKKTLRSLVEQSKYVKI